MTRFEQIGEFDDLALRLGKLAGTIAETVEVLGPSLKDEVEKKQSGISTLEQQLNTYVSPRNGTYVCA